MSSDDAELVPAVIDALKALWTPLLRPAKVLDGDPVNWATGEHLTVGMGGGDDTAETTSARSGMGRRREETATITCAVWAAGGSTDIKTYRDLAFAMFRLARAAVHDDPQLRGTVTRAEVTDYTYQPRRGPKGTGAAVAFTVTATSL